MLIENAPQVQQTWSSQQLKKPHGLTGKMYRRAMFESIAKLNPKSMVRNPVMFVVEVGSVLTLGLWIQALGGNGEAPAWYIGSVSLWLWFTVLFANFSEALAEGRGKLRQMPFAFRGKIRRRSDCAARLVARLLIS